jgi:hypothetical protein
MRDIYIVNAKCAASFIGIALAFLLAPAVAWSAAWHCTFTGGEDVTFAADRNRGVVTTNISTTEAVVHEGAGAISFFEPLPTGAANLTTIVVGTGEASRSLNTLTSLEKGSFLAIQVMGKCQLLSDP